MAYIYDLDKQLPAPVHLLQGYPFNYGPALKAGTVPAVACYTLLVRASAVAIMREAFNGSADLGPEYTCVDFSLRLHKQGSQVRRPATLGVPLVFSYRPPSVALHGFAWLCMAVHGCAWAWLCMAVHGCACLLLYICS